MRQMNFNNASATTVSKNTSFISQTTRSLLVAAPVKSPAMSSSWSAAPMIATTPPMAIIAAEAKKAVPCCWMPISAASMIRTSRSAIITIQRSRWRAISRARLGRAAASRSITWVAPKMQATKSTNAARSGQVKRALQSLAAMASCAAKANVGAALNERTPSPATPSRRAEARAAASSIIGVDFAASFEGETRPLIDRPRGGRNHAPRPNPLKRRRRRNGVSVL